MFSKEQNENDIKYLLQQKAKELKKIKENENSNKANPFDLSGDFIKFKQNPVENNDMIIDTIPKSLKIDYSAPWLTERTKQYSGMVQLHYEILDFYNFIKPIQKEDDLRVQSIKEFKDFICKNIKGVKVKTFGSFPNKLHLPDSDIDVVVFQDRNNEDENLQEQKILNQISQLLIKHDKVSFINIINAKVPIIKMRLKSTNIYMDVW